VFSSWWRKKRRQIMAIPNWVKDVIDPIAGLVDNLTTTNEEKTHAKAVLIGAQSTLVGQALDYEGKIIEAKADIIKAEATGSVWQRNWRPWLMMSFGFILVWNWVIMPLLVWILKIIWPECPLPPQLDFPADFWTTLKYGITGYIIGRSGEKITTAIVGETNVLTKAKAKLEKLKLRKKD
jgi:hypothetical protein